MPLVPAPTDSSRRSESASQTSWREPLSGARFRIDSARDPLWNMACDSWMATDAPLSAGEGMFRVYRWRPAGLTIGANQRWERALNLSALGRDEIAVRRITGGRAIYHDEGELTYAVAIECATLDPALVNVLSHTISQAIIKYLRSVGFQPELTNSRSGSPLNRGRASRHCFGSLTRHEITVEGVKVAAGAQRIFPSRYFQHGSLKTSGLVIHPALYGQPAGKPSRSEGFSPGEANRHESDSKLLSLSEFFASEFNVPHLRARWRASELDLIKAKIPTLDARTNPGASPGNLQCPRTGPNVVGSA